MIIKGNEEADKTVKQSIDMSGMIITRPQTSH